ncbi:MAG: LysR family transcriptional regulator [Longimicrobiales bacterium]
MDTINYRHLRYFWSVVREGGVTAAARALNVSQSAVSAQIRKLEAALGHSLFDRSGRSLVLSAEGKVAYQYADEIFSLGRELQDTLVGGLKGRPLRVTVGLSATVPNLIAYHFLEPAFGLADPVSMVMREKSTDLLLADLATGSVDMVLSDMPVPPDVSVRAFNHPLGSSQVDILAPPLLAHRLREGFPASLNGEPFLLPTDGYTLRRSLQEWFLRQHIQPRVFAEIEDNDLINVFAEGGAGMFAAPRVITADIQVRYAVEVVGEAEGVLERFYAITAHRHLEHPVVAAITKAARIELAEQPGGLGPPA